LVVYLRLLSASAAAAATMTITAAPIARYVAIGVGLAGGVTTGLGEAVIIGVGVAAVGATVG